MLRRTTPPKSPQVAPARRAFVIGLPAGFIAQSGDGLQLFALRRRETQIGSTTWALPSAINASAFAIVRRTRSSWRSLISHPSCCNTLVALWAASP